MIKIGKTPTSPVETQCRKPTGLLGRLTLWRMNKSHSKLTDWGLTHVTVEPGFIVLDVGCGGGRTVGKLSAMAAAGKVSGIDHAEASVAASRRYNAPEIKAGRVEIRQADVASLPFAAGTFDLVTGVETHFWWPDIPSGLREIRRVLKPGGAVLLIAEVYRGANTAMSRACEKYAPVTGMTVLTPAQHHELLASAGFSAIAIDALPDKGWLTAEARK